MPLEIERKFLVQNDNWRNLASGVAYRQGYLSTEAESTVRVRIAGDRAFLTIKGKTTQSTRREYEYPIPLNEAEEMLDYLCHRPLIEKTRYRIPIEDLVWEVDEFHGENQGLIMAEVELKSEDQAIALPHWIGLEVSGDSRYYNSYLSRHPYQSWQ